MTNNRLKELIALRDRSKVRRESGTYIVEGLKMCGEAPRDMILETFVTAGFEHSHAQWLKGRAYEIVDDRTFDRISDTKTPQGIMSVLRQPDYTVEDIIESGDLYVILEDIQDPGNLGTIVRTAEGAGASGIILSKGCVDIYNPKTIRSTMGSIYRLPFVYTDDLAATIAQIRSGGIEIYAAHLMGKTDYDDITYRRAAFLIGNEGNGLREETAALADTYIRIPMKGQVESLNAAVAASILMYEFSRQMRKVD